MALRRWRILPPFLAALLVLVIVTATASSSSGGLHGSWRGYVNRDPGGKAHRVRLTVFVNASERGGTWRVSASCHGVLHLDSISNGYHHYREDLARGARCRGGGIDCLERFGNEVQDLFQPVPSNPAWSSSTLKRVSS